jgi:hypothetical protein
MAMGEHLGIDPAADVRINACTIKLQQLIVMQRTFSRRFGLAGCDLGFCMEVRVRQGHSVYSRGIHERNGRPEV